MEVILTETAELRIKEILSFVESEFGIKSREKLTKKFIAGFKQLSFFTKSGKESKKEENHFQLVLNKRTSLYYEIQSEKIYILTAFDNRMDEQNRH